VLPAFVGLSIGNIFIGVDGEWLAMAAAVKPRSHNVRAYRGRAALNPTDRYAWALGAGVLSFSGRQWIRTALSIGIYTAKEKNFRWHSTLKSLFCYCRFDQSLMPD